MEARDSVLVDRVQEYFGVDEEDKAVERVRGTVTLVILRVDGPDGAPEDAFFRLEVMITGRSRKWVEQTVLWWKNGYTPWGGITVNGQVPEQVGGLELGEQKS